MLYNFLNKEGQLIPLWYSVTDRERKRILRSYKSSKNLESLNALVAIHKETNDNKVYDIIYEILSSNPRQIQKESGYASFGAIRYAKKYLEDKLENEDMDCEEIEKIKKLVVYLNIYEIIFDTLK